MALAALALAAMLAAPWEASAAAGSKRAIGAGKPGSAAAPVAHKRAAVKAMKPDPAVFRFIPPKFTHQDSLFLVAATGEPRFQTLRDAAEKELLAGDTATLDYLLARRLSGQTPRQRHFVETVFKLMSDSGKNPAPTRKLGSALPGAADSIRAQLLHIGSELGDSTFLPVACVYLRDDSVEVRKSALRSLGCYPSPRVIPLLLDGLDSVRDLERQARLWALDKQSAFKDWPRLIPILADGNLYNRQLARRIAAKSAGDWTLLEGYVPTDRDPETQLEWVLLALETPGAAAKAYVRKTLPAMDPETRKFIESILPRPMRNLGTGPGGLAGMPGPAGQPQVVPGAKPPSKTAP
jgi:hypothetical protein